MSVTEMLNAVRQEHQKLAQEQKEKEMKALQEKAHSSNQPVDSLLYKAYYALNHKIQASCGLPDNITILISYNELYYTDEPDTLQQLFQARCGLNIAPCDNIPDYLIISIGNPAKKCNVTIDGKNIELDFPELIAENRRRCQLWQDSLPQTAKKFIATCKECLDTMPIKHYGIPAKTCIMYYEPTATNRSHGCTPFEGKLSIQDFKIPYSQLTHKQLAELATEINRHIDQGNITFNYSTITGGVLWVFITRRPQKRVPLTQLYFDYQEFYSPYDDLTEPLQKVFDTIVTGAHFPKAADQILTLTPQRTLTYWLQQGDGVDLDLLKSINSTAHMQGLINTLYKHFQNISLSDDIQCQYEASTYSSPRGCAHGAIRTNERVEFPVDIVASTTDDPILKQQHTIEHVIAQIKTYRIQYLAKRVIELALTDFQKHHVHRYAFNKQYPAYALYQNRQYIIDADEDSINQLAEAGISTESIKINLSQIEDTNFLKAIERAVHQQSDGTLSVDIASSTYQLHFS